MPRSPSAMAPPSGPPSGPLTPSGPSGRVLPSPGKTLNSWRDFESSEELSSLNWNLSQYIELVQKFEGGHQGGVNTSSCTTINVNIDRSKIGEITEKYSEGLADLKKRCTQNDKIIAGLLSEIFKLESQIKLLNRSNSDKLSVVGDLELTIGQLDGEVARLKASLAFYNGQKTIFEKRAKAFEEEIAGLTKRLESAIKELTGKRVENAELSSEIYSLEKELRFRISVLGRELVGERSKSSINLESIRSSKGEHYKIWMEKELRALKENFEQLKADAEITLESNYKEKKESLEASLISAEAEADKPDKESTLLKMELETLKLKLSEVEANSQQLKVKKLEISTEVEIRREAYKTQLSAKDRELERLKAEHEKMKMKYDEWLQGINTEQVALYSNTLTPEIRRISYRFGSEQLESSRTTINYTHNTVSATSLTTEGTVSNITNGNGV